MLWIYFIVFDTEHFYVYYFYFIIGHLHVF